MPEHIKAVFAYTPRIKQERVVELEELAELIQARTSFNSGTIHAVLAELRDVVLFYSMSGYPVRLGDLGIFGPKIHKDGKFSLNYKMGKYLKSEMNVKGKFRGTIHNRNMIGKSVEDMIERWNDEHPEDKIKKR